MKSGNLNILEPSGPLQACNGTALPLPVTPWSRVLPENLILPQVIKGISHIHGTLKFITVLTKVRHLALS